MAGTVPTYGIGRAGGLAATMGYGAGIVVLVRIPSKAIVLIGADPSARCLRSADGSLVVLCSANPAVRKLVSADPSFVILESSDPRARELRGEEPC